MSAGDRDINKDFVTSGSIPGADVQNGLLQHLSAWINLIPGSHPLLLHRYVPSDLMVESCREVLQLIMPTGSAWAYFTLLGVLPTLVKGLVAQSAVAASVLAPRA